MFGSWVRERLNSSISHRHEAAERTLDSKNCGSAEQLIEFVLRSGVFCGWERGVVWVGLYR